MLDLTVIGAGAAGLWAGRVAGERRTALQRALDLAILDSRAKVGAKILMSGGTRCNLTHTVVLPEDYRGGNRNRVARVLRAHPSTESLRVFREELGVAVKQEPNGKIFPADDSARTVLAALLVSVERSGVPIHTGQRCIDLVAEAEGWRIDVEDPTGTRLPSIRSRRVLIATGGCSFPKSGSDGTLFPILRRLGHEIVPLVPALTPLVLGGSLHTELSGISLPATLCLFEAGKLMLTATGPLLFTHAGLSGPAALDLSGPFARARADRPEKRLEVFASFLPGRTTDEVEANWLARARLHPAATVRSLWDEIPRRLLDALARQARIDPARPLAQTPREDRRRLIQALTEFPIPALDVLGFQKAEVTSGGIPLEEVDSGLESRIASGLHFAGEVLHVDGRLGGFNFQWAWSSATVAAEAAVDRLTKERAG